MRRFLREKDGAAAAEFALIAPVLLVLLLGTADFGWAIVQAEGANAGAQAGASYAVTHGFNVARVGNAVTEGSSLRTISDRPAPVEFCGCPAAGGISSVSTALPCTATCANGNTAGTYAVVAAQANYAPLLTWPLAPNAFTALVTVRLD